MVEEQADVKRFINSKIFKKWFFKQFCHFAVFQKCWIIAANIPNPSSNYIRQFLIVPSLLKINFIKLKRW